MLERLLDRDEGTLAPAVAPVLEGREGDRLVQDAALNRGTKLGASGLPFLLCSQVARDLPAAAPLKRGLIAHRRRSAHQKIDSHRENWQSGVDLLESQRGVLGVFRPETVCLSDSELDGRRRRG